MKRGMNAGAKTVSVRYTDASGTRYSKHAGRARERTSRGISNGFRNSWRQVHGEPTAHIGSTTKPWPWKVRQQRRRANKIARASRKANRP